ncbi:REP-associated tyrosine transposase [Frateuria hangzhouensis]|uniref:REP-associated tyrosine transposase n=1 Tax=Frateuria hangzhouensis TaxID=2995589 RepID=UPI002260E6FA|nr:transposase [Frateuria sp. STR12]MCX7514483.1 transposase [Frateuria sp. STR12]
MSNYLRAWQPGGTFFFTLTLANRESALLTRHIELLRSTLREARRARPFRVNAMVVLPEHLHLLCTLPHTDADYATRIAHLKAGFSRDLPGRGSSARSARRERGIWQRRYWEHAIRDERDLRTHIDYIHYNPVKHGHVDQVRDWPWSTFHRFVTTGFLPPDWAGIKEGGSRTRFGE